VFGGANFDGEMGVELVRSVHCIDAAVTGEGELAFPRLLCALAAGEDPGAVPGVVRRGAGAVTGARPVPPAPDLDEIATPDYGEYFQHVEDLGLLPAAARRKVLLPIETSRGCWWGAKHHCTFCGLNGTMMRFRAKSPERVLEELAQQARRYRTFRFEAVDNILDMAYLKSLFPAVLQTGADYEFFYEVKSNLTRAQLKLLARAGVSYIQPGLESLSSAVLRLMRKGVTAAQNVNLLRWARYYGIDVSWNVLWGFPGETEQDVADQAAVMPHLVHLQPPSSAGRIWLERFSPLHADGGRVMRRPPAPERSYRYVYPGQVDLDRVAYFFDYELAGALLDSVYADLHVQVESWSQAWRAGPPPPLTYWSAPHFVQIYDGRRQGHEGTYTFEGPLADLYVACSDRPITAAAVRERLEDALPVEDVVAMFDELAQRGLLFLDGSFALALALPASSGR
jgi:ribosomal peptide maturation radical SAM protein 1